MILTYYTATTMIIIAYLLGSIPSAVWIGKKYYGIDIREHGSKNAGTTNMLRVLGRRAALPVFALDFLKGFVAVTIIELMQYDDLIGQNDLINLKIVAVFAAVLGHIFPIFAGFRGGKGVAVGLGFGLNGHLYNGIRNLYGFKQQRMLFVAKRIARAGLLQSAKRGYVARVRLGNFGTAGGMDKGYLANALALALGSIVNIGI